MIFVQSPQVNVKLNDARCNSRLHLRKARVLCNNVSLAERVKLEYVSNDVTFSLSTCL